MLKGELWLDYDDGETEAHWNACVTHAILRDDEIIVEFAGHDQSSGKFSGSFKAKKAGPHYIGGALFTVKGSTSSASVLVTLNTKGDVIALQGTWQDSGDSDAYDLSVELE